MAGAAPAVKKPGLVLFEVAARDGGRGGDADVDPDAVHALDCHLEERVVGAHGLRADKRPEACSK